MPVTNFIINKTLEKQIKVTIQRKGFQSKAEFFRLAAINFINDLNRPFTEEDRFKYLATQLSKAVHKKLSKKKISSIRKQLEKL